LDLPIVDWSKEEGIADEEMRERIENAVENRAAERAARFGPDVMRYVEKALLLQTLDHDWREHIVQLDHLRQFVGLRGYGQRDPLNEYKSEALELFENLLSRLRRDAVRQLMNININVGEPEPVRQRELPPMQGHHINPQTGEDEMQDPGGDPSRAMRRRPEESALDPNDPKTWGRVGRNSACPCGSGKKYKHCHGAIA
jgi:preprotein translocase subunit SecA